jgi:hypothetical protein
VLDHLQRLLRDGQLLVGGDDQHLWLR